MADRRGSTSRPTFVVGGGSNSPSRDVSDDDSPAEEPAGTPGIEELRRTLSFKRLQSLGPNEIRQSVWRPPNAPKKRPRDVDQLVGHSIRTAIRAALLAYSARTTFNLVFVLLSALRSRRLQARTLVRTLYAPSATHFGKMLGAFCLLYHLSFGGLRIFNPGPRGRGKSERWHASVAGAISGLSILGDLQEARIGVAQQLAVRGLESIAHRQKINIPNAAVLLFGASCGQIMYAFMASRATLDRGYYSWIQRASQSPRLAVGSMEAEIRGAQTFGVAVAEASLKIRGVTPANRTVLERMVAAADPKTREFPRSVYEPCAITDLCTSYNLQILPTVFRWILPVYTALSFAPALVLRRKAVMRDPTGYLSRSAVRTFRSSAFLATFVGIFHSWICLRSAAWRSTSLPPWLRSILVHRFGYWIAGFATCLSLYWEDSRRRAAAESFWRTARKNGFAPHVPAGDVVLASTGLAVLMDSWQHARESLNPLVRTVLYQALGA